MNLPIDASVFILAVITVIIFLLYLREYHLRQKISREGEKTLEEYRQKSFEILHKSINKSQDILGEAELEGVKIVADTKFFNEKMEKDYEEKLTEITTESQKSIQQAQDKIIAYIQELQTHSDQLEQYNQQQTQARINQVFGRMEERLADFLVSTEQKTLSSIEVEIKAARELIESYKTSQLKLIDENILAIMEQTLSVVLGKKLSLKDQMDFIYEALEKAKADKFIV